MGKTKLRFDKNMDLELLISEAYDNYQAKLKAKAEAQIAFENKEVEKAITSFYLEFNAVVSKELQEALGIQVCAVFNQQTYAFFSYKNVQVVIKYGPYNGGEWGIKDDLNQYLDHIPSKNLANYLLARLGEIRKIKQQPDTQPESTMPDNWIKIQEAFNRAYLEFEAIAQSEEWQQLCQAKVDSPELKTHLEDVLHYLSEAMDCLDGYIEVRNDKSRF